MKTITQDPKTKQFTVKMDGETFNGFARKLGLRGSQKKEAVVTIRMPEVPKAWLEPE